MMARGESEDVDNITNETVKYIVHPTVLNVKGKVYHKPDFNFKKIN
jgi:hypothetical protein